MSDRFFLDTNIFVYSFDDDVPQKSKRAKGLIREALTTHKGAVSYQVVQEFFSVAFKRFAPPMQGAEAERYLGTVFRPLLSVQSSIGLYSEALRLYGGNRLSWYDSLIVSAALQADCSFLFTEDLQHGQKFGNLQIVNPFL